MIAMINNVLLRGLTAVSSLKARIGSERGQGIIEYVVLAGFIGLVAAAALAFLLPDAFDNMTETISNCVQFDTPCP